MCVYKYIYIYIHIWIYTIVEQYCQKYPLPRITFQINTNHGWMLLFQADRPDFATTSTWYESTSTTVLFQQLDRRWFLSFSQLCHAHSRQSDRTPFWIALQWEESTCKVEQVRISTDFPRFRPTLADIVTDQRSISKESSSMFFFFFCFVFFSQKSSRIPKCIGLFVLCNFKRWNLI